MGIDEYSSRDGVSIKIPSRVVLKGIGIGGSVLALGASTASAHDEPKPIDSCTTIDGSGEYVLESDLTTEGGDEACIEITADDVTVRNLKIQSWDEGIHYRDVAGGTVRDITFRGNGQ